ncbi:transposase domain-containing protein [Rhodocyclus purpureus]|uniref:transposase domain-containing protein n=1 Tax=Rhodocyclus purpureus TaxID=1067 RepID=UPI001911B0F7|nr:transposase domain-containing protein [Rhodocyclus purpureus]MBK5915347.1 hypothetical protein [Rhodocyclus purpureus]
MPETRETKPDTAPDIAASAGSCAAIERETQETIAASVDSHVDQHLTDEIRSDSCPASSGGTRQSNDKRRAPEVWLSTARASALSGIPDRTLRDQCAKGKLVTRAGPKDALGRAEYEILLDSLPPQAQAAYYVERQKAAGVRPDPLQVPDAERETLAAKYEAASETSKRRAQHALAALLAFVKLRDAGCGLMKAYETIQTDYGVSRNTLKKYVASTERFDRADWLLRLLPDYTGNGGSQRIDWHRDAWDFFIERALVPRAKVGIAYRQTVEEGLRQGWPKLPNIKAARQAIEDFPQTVVDLVKEGPTALKRRAPTVERDYTAYALHEVWSPDGRKLDLAVCDTEGRFGQKGRLLRLWLYAFLEVRTRYFVGYAIGSTLNADLVRAAFLDALRTTDRVVPQRIAPDNGMEVATKEHTGGTPWRRRGKVRDGEMIGTFPQLGIEVEWATVAHGQAKPVERAFRTLKENMETRPEFRGAYLGSNAPDRPEEFERSKAVPVELVEKLFREVLDSYHRRPHRGHGMNGKSPALLYSELMSEPGYVPRRITESQRRMCALSRTEITIRADGSFTIHGARYYSPRTAELARGRGYWATYNPNDLAEPVTVYRGETKKAEGVKQIERTPGNSKEAAARIMKERARFNKATKAQAEALGAIQSARGGHIARLTAEKFPEAIDKETGEILPVGKVVQMVQNRVSPGKQTTPPDPDQEAKRAKLRQELEEIEAAELRKLAAR